jgi:hypothetical protein
MSCGLLAGFEDLSLSVLIKARDDARSVGLRVFGIDMILECMGIGGDDGFVGVWITFWARWRLVKLASDCLFIFVNTLAVRSGLPYSKAGF